MNSVPLASDKILISDLRLHACVGEDRWRKRRPQPIKLSATLSVDLAQAGRTDSIASTVNYGTLCRQLLEKSDGKEYAHLRQMAMDSIALVLEKPGVVEATMEVEAMNQFLLADCVGVRLRRWKDNTPGGSYDEAYIKNLQLNVLIGVNPPEREFKQVVVTNISFVTPTWKAPDWLGMHDALVKVRVLPCPHIIR